METSEFPPIIISVFGLEVTSEVVKIEDNDYGGTTFHIKSSCDSKAWGTRSQMYTMSVPKDYENLGIQLESTRKTAAELVAKEELGAAPPKNTLLVMEVLAPDGKWLKVASTVDIGFGPSRLGQEYLDVMGFKPLGSRIAEIRSDGSIDSLPLYAIVMKFGEKSFQTLAVPHKGGLPCIVGGDFIQQASRTELIFELLDREHWRALRNVARCKKKVVLIIGKYGDHRARLEQIEKLLADRGYQGLLLDNFPDIEEQSLPEKMVLFASIARFVLCDDSAPSGHIDELRICSEMRFTTAILRPLGRASTAMHADLAVHVDYMCAFQFEEQTFDQALVDALRWAEEKVLERSASFNRLYGWRSPEKILK
jgi:hypothetical protein